MHTLFEGVASHHLQALLQYLINIKKSLSLAQLNTALRTHKYSYSETKPSPINKDSNGMFHIKQTGMIMISLYITHIFCSISDDDIDTIVSLFM